MKNPSFFFAGFAFVVALLAPNSVYLPLVVNGFGGNTIPPVTATLTNTPIPSTATSTFTPTFTRTPTLTFTPTESATATPTATAANGATVLNNHSSYTSTFGARSIVGEVQNNSASAVHFVSVVADIYNANGQLIDTQSTYAERDILPAGGKSCYRVIFFAEPVGWNSYQLSANYSVATEQPRALTITSVAVGSNPTYYELIGQVRNDSQQDQKFVKIVGTLYSSDGMVIRCDLTYANAETMAPGASSSWKLSFFGVNPVSVGSYVVVAD